MSITEEKEWKTVGKNSKYSRNGGITPYTGCGTTSSQDKRRPIMSYGIILFTMRKKIPLFLVSQRRDTVEYVDFIRGQYNNNSLNKIFSLMTIAERERMEKYDFNELWDDLWINKNHRIYTDCFQKAYEKFQKIKDKIPSLLEETAHPKKEPPWGFPKGKKNNRETPVQCALREFSEETKLDSSLITILSNKPVVEIYKGSNDKLYGTNYYIAHTPDIIPIQNLETSGIRKITVSEELGDVQWLDLENALKKLNVKRQKLLLYINRIISKSMK